MTENVKVVTADGAVTVPATLEAAQAACAEVQVQNMVLRNELATADAEIANRDLKEFAPLMPTPEAQGYWRKRLIANRAETLTTLRGLVALKLASPGAPVVPPAPLHNRSTARPVPPAVVAGLPVGGVDEAQGAKIRNRAHEIAKADRIPFLAAFRRAERELSVG